MEELIVQFTNQLRESLAITQQYKFIADKNTSFHNVILTGLGGSGIAGSIVQNYVFDKIKVPFVVNKDYFLPAFVDKNSLVIVSSYSGNTEETVAALQTAIKAKATIMCITSGGKIAAIAQKKNIDCIIVPSGMPPRACIGYSMLQIIKAFEYFGLIKDVLSKDIPAAIALLDSNEKDIRKKAKTIAQKLLGKLPVIYSAADYEGMAIRFRQQLNENSKILTWHHAIPEMNHNELVGWRDKDPNKVVLILRNDNDYDRVQMRMEINKKVFKQYTPNIIELYSKGNSYWQRIFYFIHLTDYISTELAKLRQLDATEVKVIDFLKSSLAKA
ncbi:MAG: bifunctional phosphoglucose/phosphomannose isomerase [Phycisphaerales bacterium]|nr:bifunctional phosphoglucose/phosphomannose isomerase [Phycisphaerales bacterium]